MQEVSGEQHPRTRTSGSNRRQEKKHIKSVVFIPHTQYSELKHRLNEMEQRLDFKAKFRYVEELGTTIGQELVRKDPEATECGRPSCMPCRTAPGRCMRQGCIYKMTCLLCKEQGEKISLYIGESARTAYDRGSEHLSAIRRRDEGSPLVEHHVLEHSREEEPRFSMEVV